VTTNVTVTRYPFAYDVTFAAAAGEADAYTAVESTGKVCKGFLNRTSLVRSGAAFI
jgi:hypothetical protein